jgi:hypothetical protein
MRFEFLGSRGGGPELFAAGAFTATGGQSALRIAKWNGASWAPLGTGLDNTASTLVVFDDGTGPALYVGGIAKWNGVTWSALGSGLRAGSTVGSTKALAVFDDGRGPALYAAGFITTAGGLAANNIARWSGTSC